MADIDALATSLNLLIGKYGLTLDEFAQLLTGPSDGGPTGNGLYPVTTPSGGKVNVPSFLRLLASGIGDQSVLAPIVARVEALAGQVDRDAQRSTVAGALVQPLAGGTAFVPVGGNPNELTASGVADLAINASVDGFVAATNTAEAFLTIGTIRYRVTNGGGVSIPAGGLAAGTIVTVQRSPGGVYVLTGTRPLLGGAANLGAVVAQLTAIAGVVQKQMGAAIAYTAGASPNEIIVAGSTAQPFDALILVSNTAEAFLTAGGERFRIADGGGTSIPAGGLVAGTIVTFERSPGGVFVRTASRPLLDVRPNGADSSAFVTTPWGSITFAANGTRTVAAVQRAVVVVGSSNASDQYIAAPQLPANVAAAALNEFIPGTGLTFVGETQAQPGAPMVTIGSQLAASPSYANGTAAFVLTFYGMNDARTLFYHSQGGVRQQIAALKAAIVAMRAKGVEPVLNTIFPPDPRASTVALDPNWFADTSAFPGGGSGQSMDYPVYRAAPVDPENHMIPPKSAVLTEVRAWTAGGAPRTGYRRIWDVNRRIRRLAEETGCALLDFEAAAYRLAIETVADLSAGLDTFYNQADPLHPKMALYDAAVTPVIRQWAQAQAAGEQNAGRVFTGFVNQPLGPQVDLHVVGDTIVDGNLLVGATGGSNHTIKRDVTPNNGNAILSILGGSGSVGATFYSVNGAGAKESASQTALAVSRDAITERSISVTGTVNANGADYAEYVRKADGCGHIAKGDVCGVDRHGLLVKLWSSAVRFVVKSTDPNLVGGDTWAAHLGPRPEAPIYEAPLYEGPAEPQKPAEPAPFTAPTITLPEPPVREGGEEDEAFAAALVSYAEKARQYEVDLAAYDAARRAYDEIEAAAVAAHDAAVKEHGAELAAWEQDLETARQTVDRIAFCGQVPVNVDADTLAAVEAALDDGEAVYLVAVARGGGIGCQAVRETDMTLHLYMRRLGAAWAVRDGQVIIDVQHG